MLRHALDISIYLYFRLSIYLLSLRKESNKANHPKTFYQASTNLHSKYDVFLIAVMILFTLGHYVSDTIQYISV